MAKSKHKKRNQSKKEYGRKPKNKKHKNKAPKQKYTSYKGDASWVDGWDEYDDEFTLDDED